MANEELQPHNRYYLDSRMVVLSCGKKLFRIPYWRLGYSPILFRLAKSDSETDGIRGSSNDTAIPIDDHVSVDEFTIFLDFFYRDILRREIPAKEWCNLLVISSKLDCRVVRVRAIEELTARISEVSSIDRIELGNNHGVPQWLPDAYADAFVREAHLTTEEGEKLGLGVMVRVLEGRDRCKRNGWSSSGDRNVTQLVKEIFPTPAPSTSPANKKLAGRLVYKGAGTGPKRPVKLTPAQAV